MARSSTSLTAAMEDVGPGDWVARRWLWWSEPDRAAEALGDEGEPDAVVAGAGGVRRTLLTLPAESMCADRRR